MLAPLLAQHVRSLVSLPIELISQQAFRRLTPKAAKARALVFSLLFGTIVCVAIGVLFSLGKITEVAYVAAVAALLLMVCFFVASRTLGKVLRARSPSDRANRSGSASGKGALPSHLQIIMSSAKWLGFTLFGHIAGAVIFAVAPWDTVWQYVGNFFLFFFVGFSVFIMTRYYRMAMKTRAARMAVQKSRADRRNKSAMSTASIVPEESASATNSTQDGMEGNRAVAWGADETSGPAIDFKSTSRAGTAEATSGRPMMMVIQPPGGHVAPL